MMDLASIAAGVGIAAVIGGAGAGLARLFRRGGQIEAQTESNVNTTQQTAAALRGELQAHDARDTIAFGKIDRALDAIRTEAATRFDRVDQKLDKITSDVGSTRQVVAAHDSTIEQHGERIVRMESRQSPPPMLGRK